MIIKHRRGTTQAWLELDLIPEAGELVIEECEDGGVKGKLGNGILRFSELPYITDEKSLNICLQEIAETADSLSTEINDLRVILDRHISNKIEANVNAIVTNAQFINANTEAIAQNKNAIIEATNSLSADISDLRTTIDQDISSKIDTNINAIAANAQSINANAEAIAQNKNAIEQLIDGTTTEELDSIMELVDYVNTHGTEVTGIHEDINTNAAKIAELEAKLKIAQDLIDRLMGGAIICTNVDSGLIIPEENLDAIISYGEAVAYSPITTTEEKQAAGQLLKAVIAKYTSGPNKGATLTLTRQSLDENGGGVFTCAEVTGSQELSGQWTSREWSPTWLNGTNGIVDTNSAGYANKVTFSEGATFADMPAAIGNGKAEVLSGNVYVFNGWNVSGEKLTSEGVSTYNTTNEIPVEAINASSTATYTTITNIRNKATKLNTEQSISIGANDAAIYKISNIGNLDGGIGVEAYIKAGVLTVNGKTGLGFTKTDDRKLSETYMWNAFQIPVAFDGEVKKLNQLGKKLKVTVYADTAVGIQRNNSTGARSSIWVSGVPGMNYIGKDFTFTQSNATNGTISTTYDHFSGYSVSKVSSNVGNIEISTIAANESAAKTDTTWLTSNRSSSENGQIAYSFEVDGGIGGFKIGVFTAFYNRQASGSKFYALVPKLSYKVEVAE